jgi:hypothetical protein
MMLAVLGDAGVTGVLVAGKITEGHVLECARLNLARTVEALRITVPARIREDIANRDCPIGIGSGDLD